MNKSVIRKALKSHLFENFISLGIIQGLNYLLPLITIPFLFNQLGTEKYGLVNFTFAFIQYFIILTDFGFGLSGTRYIAANRNDFVKVNRFVNSATISRLIMASISFFIVLLCVCTIPSLTEYKLFSFLFYGQVIGNALTPTWFFQGMERMMFNTIIHVTTKTISILPLFVIVQCPQDYLYIPICYSLGTIVAGSLSILLMRRTFGVKFYITSFREVKEVIIDSSRYFLSRISNSIFTNTNTFLLGLCCGNVQVGYYSLADKVHTAVDSLYGPVNGTLFPYMTKNRNLSLYKKILIYGFFVNLFFITVLFFLLPVVCPVLFKGFSPISMQIIHILLVDNVISFVNTFIGYPFLGAYGHPNYCNYSLIGTSIFHIIGLFLLYAIGYMTILNVAWLSVLSSLFHMVIRIYGVKKYKLWTNN